MPSYRDDADEYDQEEEENKITYTETETKQYKETYERERAIDRTI